MNKIIELNKNEITQTIGGILCQEGDLLKTAMPGVCRIIEGLSGDIKKGIFTKTVCPLLTSIAMKRCGIFLGGYIVGPVVYSGCVKAVNYMYDSYYETKDLQY